MSPTFRQTVTDVALDWKSVLGACRLRHPAGRRPELQLPGGEHPRLRHPLLPHPGGAERLLLLAGPPGRRRQQLPRLGVGPGVGVHPRLARSAHPVYPANGSTVGDPFYFQWTPSEPVTSGDANLSLASTYTLQMSDRSNFQGNVWRCTTTLTTLVPPGRGLFPRRRGHLLVAGPRHRRLQHGQRNRSDVGHGLPLHLRPEPGHAAHPRTRRPRHGADPVLEPGRRRGGLPRPIRNTANGAQVVQDTPSTTFRPAAPSPRSPTSGRSRPSAETDASARPTSSARRRSSSTPCRPRRRRHQTLSAHHRVNDSRRCTGRARSTRAGTRSG